MLITNKYENKCTKCKQTIPIDTQVDWTKGVGIAHIECPKPEDKWKGVRKYSFKKSRTLKSCQLCKVKLDSKNDEYYYENYKLCEPCWEETLGE